MYRLQKDRKRLFQSRRITKSQEKQSPGGMLDLGAGVPPPGDPPLKNHRFFHFSQLLSRSRRSFRHPISQILSLLEELRTLPLPPPYPISRPVVRASFGANPLWRGLGSQNSICGYGRAIPGCPVLHRQPC